MWLVWVQTVLAGAADCAAWADCPVAADLHPVWWDYGRRYQVQVESAMTGRKASPAFSPMVAQADVHWRLQAATGRGLDLPGGTAGRWADYALAGSLLAVDRVVVETAERSEDVAALRTAADVLFDPSAELVFKKNGDVTLRHESGGPAGRWVRRREAQAELEEADLRAHARARPVRVSLSAGWTLRDPDADPERPLLSWTAQLSVRNAGLTMWRVELDPIALSWDASARQRLVGDLSAGVGLHGGVDLVEPARWNAGLTWRPEAQVSIDARTSSPVDGTSWRVDLACRVELGAFLPGRLQPSLAGLPAVRRSAPNALATWAPPR